MQSSGYHEEFVQLCALSTAGELTDEEWIKLEKHLIDCPECRSIKLQYDSLVANVLPALAAESQDIREVSKGGTPWSPDKAEAALMSAVGSHRYTLPKTADLSPQRVVSKQRRLFLLAAIALFCGGTILGFLLNSARRKSMPQAPARAQIGPSPDRHRENADKIGLLQQKIVQDEEEVTRLRASIAERSASEKHLTEEGGQLQQELASRTQDLSTTKKENADLETQLAAQNGQSANLQAELSEAQKREADDTSQIATLEQKASVLNLELQQGDREVSRDEELLAHDRDIRNLMGARNLYIAEIYDSEKDGSNKKPFGRVFYTKDKSLVFYAYDLDQQPGVENAGTFQAWGSAGPENRDINLGLFYRDDADKKRWVLKCDDPQTIAQLNAVFVTVEPKGGSAKPTGKMLLFSYLRVTPNHP